MKRSQISWPGEPQEQVDAAGGSVSEDTGLLEQAVAALRKHDLKQAVSILSLVMCSAESPPEAERYLQQAARELYQEGRMAHAAGRVTEACEDMKILVSLNVGDNHELQTLQLKAQGFLDAALKAPTTIGTSPARALAEGVTAEPASLSRGRTAPINSRPTAEIPDTEEVAEPVDFKPLTPVDLRG